jgi:hypothetical protein
MESKYKPVQGGIYYSPVLHFYAFDISFSYQKEPDQYLDFEKSLDAFKFANILHCEPLKVYNDFESAIEHKIGFNSTIPKKLGLPELKLQSFQILIGMFEYMPNLFYFKCNYKISNFTFSMNKVIIKNYAQIYIRMN